MKQKLGLTCALVHTPKMLLLDEPTTGVDPVSRRDFWRILYGLREDGVTIVISTAYLDEAERCNRLALLHGGRALYCDTPAALKEHMPGALSRFRPPTAARCAARSPAGPGSSACCWSATACMRSSTMPSGAFRSCARRLAPCRRAVCRHRGRRAQHRGRVRRAAGNRGRAVNEAGHAAQAHGTDQSSRTIWSSASATSPPSIM